ncbi:MAG: hypothetical protein V3U96_03910 [Paracoccaceae bacterium]
MAFVTDKPIIMICAITPGVARAGRGAFRDDGLDALGLMISVITDHGSDLETPVYAASTT